MFLRMVDEYGPTCKQGTKSDISLHDYYTEYENVSDLFNSHVD